MTVSSVQALVEAELAGQTSFRTWRKAPTQATAASYWSDLSMSPGNPSPNYYAAAPNISVALARSTDGGIDHGGDVSPAVKHLTEFCVMGITPATLVPLPLVLCDYLLYYPFLDMSTTDWQELTNNVALPRYADGAGVQMIAVIVAPTLGSGNPRFQVRYTNSAGVSGRETVWFSTGIQTVNGTLITTGSPIINTGTPTVGPFLPLAPGDKGVRSIEAVNFIDADVGLISLVLVKPLATIQLRGIDAPVEKRFLMDNGGVCPVIEDDAYLNLLCSTSGGTVAAGSLHGYIKTVWN